LPGIDIELLAISAMVFAFAAFVHGSIGFGFPMVATPLLAMFFDIQTAILLTLLPTLVMNIISIAGEGQWLSALKSHLPLAGLAMLGSALGSQLLLLSDSELFKLFLAIIILFYLSSNIIKLNYHWIRKYPALAKVTFGVSAGIVGGLTNVMAPVLVIYTIESKYSKSETVQASNLTFMLGKLIQVLIFSIHGRFDAGNVLFSGGMTVFAVAGLLVGIKFRHKIEPVVYRRLLKLLLCTLATLLLIQWFIFQFAN